jgi:hypothetical protein
MAREWGNLDAEELPAAREMMDDDEYEQEYECSFDAAIRGSFFGKTINSMGARLGSWPFTPGHKVHTCWDLGFTDDTVIWFFQVIAQRPIFFDCYAASGQRLSVYIDALHEKREHYQKVCPPDQPFQYGEYYLPHDARAHSLQTGRSMQEDLVKADIRARIVPELSVQDGIQATRKLLEVCCIDEQACFVGVEALRQYQREWDEDKKAFRQKPRHDWTSHYADGMRMGAIGYREDYREPAIFVPPRLRPRALITEGMKLSELWKQIPLNPRRNTRI